MAGTAVTLDANTAPAERSFHRVGKAARDATQDLVKIGASWLKVTAIVAGLARAGQQLAAATSQARAQASTLSSQVGGRAVTRAQAGASLGLEPAAIDRISRIQETGAADPAAQASLFTRLADQAKTSAAFKRRLLPRMVEVIQAGASGVYTDQELIEAVLKGRKISVQERMARLPEQAKRELEVSAFENRTALATSRVEASEYFGGGPGVEDPNFGRTSRRGAAYRQRLEQENPVQFGFSNAVVSALPVFGDAWDEVVTTPLMNRRAAGIGPPESDPVSDLIRALPRASYNTFEFLRGGAPIPVRMQLPPQLSAQE